MGCESGYKRFKISVTSLLKESSLHLSASPKKLILTHIAQEMWNNLNQYADYLLFEFIALSPSGEILE
jgi:hypothetical protein